MPTASIAKPAEASSDRVAVERRDGRTIYTWRRPWAWETGVVLAIFAVLAVISDSEIHPWARYAALLLVAGPSGFALGVVLEYLWQRYEVRRLEMTGEGLRIGRGLRGAWMGEAIPLDKIMGAKVFGSRLAGWRVLIMVPGHAGGFATRQLAAREEAQWLADAIEAELAARGHAV